MSLCLIFLCYLRVNRHWEIFWLLKKGNTSVMQVMLCHILASINILRNDRLEDENMLNLRFSIIENGLCLSVNKEIHII